MWRAAGATVDATTSDETRLVLATVTGRYQAGLIAQHVPPDLDAAFDRFRSAPPAPEGHALNVTRLADAEVDRLLDAQRAGDDPGERRRLAADLVRRLNQLVPEIWLVAEPELVAVGPRVRGADALLGERRRPEEPWVGGIWLAE
jgi:hypothetical protein